MSAPSKAIAATLIVMAVIATGYTVYFASEYTNSLSALADFSAYAEFDPENVQTQDNFSYVPVVITFHNPSNTLINIYELDLALFLMNSTTGTFSRIGKPVIFYSEYRPIIVEASSESQVRFYICIDDPTDYKWNIENSKNNGLEFRVDPYMEIRYEVSNYDFKNIYAWGVWHWTCEPCGSGPFD